MGCVDAVLLIPWCHLIYVYLPTQCHFCECISILHKYSNVFTFYTMEICALLLSLFWIENTLWFSRLLISLVRTVAFYLVVGLPTPLLFINLSCIYVLYRGFNMFGLHKCFPWCTPYIPWQYLSVVIIHLRPYLVDGKTSTTHELWIELSVTGLNFVFLFPILFSSSPLILKKQNK